LIGIERKDHCTLAFHEMENSIGPGVANGQPDHLGRSAVDETELPEVVVLGDDRETLLAGIIPDLLVACTPKANRAHMGTAWIFRLKAIDELGAQVLVEK